MKPNLIVIGHLLKEMIIFSDQVCGPVLGGASAYFSVIASKLGTKTGIVSKIGKDMPLKLLDPLKESGVDTRGLKIEGDKSRSSELIYEKNGDKTMKYPNKGVPLTFKDIPNDYFDADIIYIAPQEWELSFQEIKKIFSQNKSLAVELAGYGGAHCSYHSKKNNVGFVKEILPYFKIAKLSIEDCRYIFGRTDVKKIAKMIIEWGVQVSIITLADKGAIIATANNIYEIPTIIQNVVDRTGAGDAFAAGFMVSYIQDGDVKKAGLFASATASIIIEKRGGMKLERIPTLAQVKKRAKKWTI